MSHDTTRKHDGMIDPSAPVQHRRQRGRTRLVILAVGTIVIAGTIGWCFLPSRSSTQFGAMTTEADVRAVRALSERDKKEIAVLAWGWTVRHAFQALRSSEFRQCIRSLKISRRQRINRFIDDQD